MAAWTSSRVVQCEITFFKAFGVALRACYLHKSHIIATHNRVVGNFNSFGKLFNMGWRGGNFSNRTMLCCFSRSVGV